MKLLFVVVGDRDIFFAEYDAVAFDHFDLFGLYDEGTVHTDEAVGRQHIFQAFHAHQ